MASLFDTIQNNRQTYKQGGELQSTSQDELQKLSSNAGMPTTPSSPLSAAGIGANADQAKMLGTPAQTTSAINIATAPTMDLQTQLREAQARKQQSAQEAANQQQALSFEGFGSLGDRVQQLATKMFNQNGSVIASTQVADPTKIAGALVTGADPAETERLLNKIGDGSATNQDILTVAKNLGYTNVSDIPALTDSIKNSFLSNAENEANFTANAIPDSAKVSDFTPDQLKSLGFTDINAMATALKVDPATLSNMSIKDLQNQFGKEQMQDFSKVGAAQATLADASSSRAEKENALQQLRELGATGVRAVEDGVKKLQASVANADTVQFNGTSYKVEDLLKSDTITGIVKAYLVDDSVAKSLQVAEPGFAKWIEDNKQVLATAADRSTAKVDDFKAIQDANSALQNPAPGVQLDSSVMKMLFPDWGTLSATTYAPPPVVGVLKNISPNDAVALSGALTNLTTNVPSAAQGIATASADQLKQAGLTDAKGINSYKDYANTTANLMDIDPNNDAAIKNVIFPGVAPEALTAIGHDANIVESFGIPLDHNSLDVVTSSGLQLRNAYLSKFGGYNADGTPLTAQQLVQYGVNADNFKNGSDMVTSVRAQIDAASKNPLFVKFGQYWSTGDLKTTDATMLGDTAVQAGDINSYNDLRQLADTAKMNPDSKKILNQKLNAAGAIIAQKVLEKVSGYTDRAAWDSDLTALKNNYTQDKFGDWQVTGNVKPQLDHITDALNKLKDAKKNDPALKGPDIQSNIDWRINEMQKTLDNYNFNAKQAAIPKVRNTPLVAIG